MTENYKNSAKEQTNFIKDQNGQLLVQPYGIGNIWRDYFDGLLSVLEREDLDVDVDLETDPDGIIKDITGEEVFAATARMKRGKPLGDDELPLEVLKEASWERGSEVLADHNAGRIQTGDCPSRVAERSH